MRLWVYGANTNILNRGISVKEYGKLPETVDVLVGDQKWGGADVIFASFTADGCHWRRADHAQRV
jgi:hypothetical protein